MTVIARLEVIPVGRGHMTDAIAEALDALDAQGVRYETTATDTIIETATAAEAFEAARAAHEAISDGRVVTSLEVDDDRGREQGIAERVAAVERARTRQRGAGGGQTTAPRTNSRQQERRQTPTGSRTGDQSEYGRRYAPGQPTPGAPGR